MMIVIRMCMLGLLLVLSFQGQTLSKKTWTGQAATGATTSFAVPANDKHTLASIVTGSPAACTLRLEGSVDGTNWFDISGTQTCTSNLMFHVVDRAVELVRVNILSLSEGGSQTLTYLGFRSGGRQ